MSLSSRRIAIHTGDPNSIRVYQREGATWSETALLLPYPPDASLSGSLALRGPDPDDHAVIAAGGRVFAENEDGGWNQIDVLPTPVLIDTRGVTADQIFVGEQFDDTAGTNAGALRIHGMEQACFPE